ncbi:hypothetical protein [Ferruginibacter sp. HRS2-29]|uniref:hypothetical protein n=1 Tax=Ferruginibacter sp. HRS2-29 TaxID=2487334 RepID=UPI0020CEDEA4|nr:hypothetical protein [Ferruginibacter sp. HRS2-29]MCP9753385.1 hypothetical protein [Ferruginibacter sp. HRS2-29]
MRFLAKLTLIFNVCFLLWVLGYVIEIFHKVKGSSNGQLDTHPLLSSIVVLGVVSIFINVFFVILFLARFSSKKMNNIPRWIVYFNLIILPMQIYFYFISK